MQRLLQRPLEAGLARLLTPPGSSAADFLSPPGEPALIAPDSVSWRVFKNPLALFVGGVAAVVLELAEPRVRTGVWQNTSFRTQPFERLRRTGHAAMMTVYGPRSRTETMIAKVRRMHDGVRGVVDGRGDGRAFSANDPALLTWVHATASFGFLEAYRAYVRPVSVSDRDRFYREGQPAAALYGAGAAPASQASLEALFEAMRPGLEGSGVVLEFLAIMRRIDVLPWPLRFVQGALVKAAVELLPAALRQQIGLGDTWSLTPLQRRWIGRAGLAADRLVLGTNPAVLACRRLGLPDHHLYR